MKKIIVIAALTVSIAACSTTTPAERRALNQNTCAGYGFKAGTDAYATCMMNLDLDQQQQDRERRQRVGAALSNMGQSMQPRRPITCNTFGSRTGVFNNATTTCY